MSSFLLSKSFLSTSSLTCLRFNQLNNYQKQAVQLDIVRRIIGQDPQLEVKYLLRTIGSTDADIVIFKHLVVVAQIELAHLADKSYKDIDAAINSRRRKLREFSPFSLGFHSYFIQMGGKWSLDYQRSLAANNWKAIYLPNINKFRRQHLRQLSRFIHRILKQAHVYKDVDSNSCKLVEDDIISLHLLDIEQEHAPVDDNYLINLYYRLEANDLLATIS